MRSAIELNSYYSYIDQSNNVCISTLILEWYLVDITIIINILYEWFGSIKGEPQLNVGSLKFLT